MLRRYAILSLWLLSLVVARAQQDPSYSHYWAMETSFNPAAAGKEEKVNAVGVYSMALTGFEHSPKTMYLSGDLPFYLLGAYHGVGAQLVSDEIGLFAHQRFALQYAYKHRLLGGVVSAGVNLGLLSEKFDGSKLDLAEGGDPAFSTSEVTGTGLDLGAGLYYTHRNWYVGASVLHATAPTVELGETNELEVARTYYLTGGYNIKLRNPFLSMHTSVLGRTDGVAYRADVTARLKYTNESKVMYAGLSYSPTNSVTVLLGGNVHGITLGYSYEVYTSAISLGNGAHELFVGYQTELNLYKKGRNRHQSVRIL